MKVKVIDGRLRKVLVKISSLPVNSGFLLEGKLLINMDWPRAGYVARAYSPEMSDIVDFTYDVDVEPVDVEITYL